MPIIPLLLAGGVFLGGSGFFVDKAGEGVNDISNGVVKLAIAGAAGYIILKKI